MWVDCRRCLALPRADMPCYVGDDRQPACARCEKARIPCLRACSVRFQHGANPSVKSGTGSKPDNEFERAQPWVNTSRSLTFLDETPELISIYDHAGENCWNENADLAPAPTPSPGLAQSGPVNERPSQRSQTNAGERTGSSETTSLGKHCRLTSKVVVHESPVASPASPQGFQQSPSKSWYPTPQTRCAPNVSADDLNVVDWKFAGQVRSAAWSQNELATAANTSSRIYLDAPIWPLNDVEEAKLLRHYVDNLARNFDLTDPYNHFRTVVPQRAATCPTLLNAIFSLSARHLSRTGAYDPLVSNRYHQECLKHLIPMLNDTAAILDENLLASTIILRHLEEIEVPVSDQTPSQQQSHLLGAHAFMTAQERGSVSGGLREAAFWTGLRQEIYFALVNQRPIIPVLEYCNIDRSFGPASDHVWACRMVVLCADVIQFCFANRTDHIQHQDDYSYLTAAVAEWSTRKPASYTPIYSAPAVLSTSISPGIPESAFPALWFTADDIVVGIQHYHIARILLASHNPCLPRLGPGRAAQLRATDEDIKDQVRILCGICLSNPATAPNFTYASMGITMAGERFTNRREQEALISVLDTCDRQHGWPTGITRKNLMLAWAWDVDGGRGEVTG